MDIYLIRHTRVSLAPGICYGQSELDLAPEFDEQVAELKQQLPSDFDRIYSSPLSRCTQLAQTFGRNITTDKRLLEYHFGDWELTAWDDIDAESLNLWMQDFVNQRPEGGETLVEMSNRVNQFLDELRESGDSRILIASHAGVIRCVWSYLLGIPLSQIFKINVGYGTVLHFQLGDNPDHDALLVE